MSNDINLIKMNNEEFKLFYERSILAYSKALAKSGACTDSESLQNAKKQIDELLPHGNDSENNYLNVITKGGEESIGVLWSLKASEDILFIADFFIYGQFRGKGYGKKALLLLEDYGRKLQLSKIKLHVFKYNESAQALYKKMGYKVVDENDEGIYMAKDL